MWLKVAKLHALNMVIIVSSNLYNMYGGGLGPHVFFIFFYISDFILRILFHKYVHVS